MLTLNKTNQILYWEGDDDDWALTIKAMFGLREKKKKKERRVKERRYSVEFGWLIRAANLYAYTLLLKIRNF